MTHQAIQITELINLAAQGDESAAQKVFPQILRELRRIAASQRRRMPAGETLGVTALVNEAYLRMRDREPDGWKARSHFFFSAARAMRDILVEDARRKASRKHGGHLDRIDIDIGSIEIAVDASPIEVLQLNELLEQLEEEDSAAHKIVMLRCFAGLSVNEVAETMGISTATVKRRWRFLRVWIAERLRSEEGR